MGKDDCSYSEEDSPGAEKVYRNTAIFFTSGKFQQFFRGNTQGVDDFPLNIDDREKCQIFFFEISDRNRILYFFSFILDLSKKKSKISGKSLLL